MKKPALTISREELTDLRKRADVLVKKSGNKINQTSRHALKNLAFYCDSLEAMMLRGNIDQLQVNAEGKFEVIKEAVGNTGAEEVHKTI